MTITQSKENISFELKFHMHNYKLTFCFAIKSFISSIASSARDLDCPNEDISKGCLRVGFKLSTWVFGICFPFSTTLAVLPPPATDVFEGSLSFTTRLNIGAGGGNDERIVGSDFLGEDGDVDGNNVTGRLAGEDERVSWGPNRLRPPRAPLSNDSPDGRRIVAL